MKTNFNLRCYFILLTPFSCEVEYCNEKVYFSEGKKRSQSIFREEEQPFNNISCYSSDDAIFIVQNDMRCIGSVAGTSKIQTKSENIFFEIDLIVRVYMVICNCEYFL